MSVYRWAVTDKAIFCCRFVRKSGFVYCHTEERWCWLWSLSSVKMMLVRCSRVDSEMCGAVQFVMWLKCDGTFLKAVYSGVSFL